MISKGNSWGFCNSDEFEQIHFEFEDFCCRPEELIRRFDVYERKRIVLSEFHGVSTHCYDVNRKVRHFFRPIVLTFILFTKNYRLLFTISQPPKDNLIVLRSQKNIFEKTNLIITNLCDSKVL